MRMIIGVLVLVLGALPAAAQERAFSTQVDAGGGLLEVQARSIPPGESDRAPKVQLLFARADTLLTVDISPAQGRRVSAALRGDGATASAFDLAVRTTVIARSGPGASLEFVCTDDVGCVPEGPLVIVAALSDADRVGVAAAVDSALAVYADAEAPVMAAPEPEPEPAPPPDPEPEAPATGRLTVNAVPFATVEVDGVRVGDTPIVNFEVTPGVHTVRFVREGFQTEEREVTVTAGEVLRVVVRMRREGG